MAFVDKNTILNVIMMIFIFNFVLFIGLFQFADRITGDVILTGSINSEETFEDSPMFIKNSDITFSFRTRVTGSEIRRELLNITIITPEGIEFSEQKWFECQIIHEKRSKPILNQIFDPILNPIFDQIIGKDCVDSAMIFTPESTGIYYIKISDTKFSTNIRLISGMAQLYNNLIFTGAFLFSAIGLSIILFVLKHNLYSSSKKEALIALMISLITVYIVVQYTSI